MRVLPRAGAGLGETAVAIGFLFGEGQLRRFGDQIGFLLANGGLLEDCAGLQFFERCQAGLDDRAGVVERRLEIAAVEPDQHLASLHALIVGNQHFGDEAANMRGDGGDVAADIGIICRFGEAPVWSTNHGRTRLRPPAPTARHLPGRKAAFFCGRARFTLSGAARPVSLSRVALDIDVSDTA